MPTFVSDTFTDATGTALTAHTGETGATWTEHTAYTVGNMVIDSADRIYNSVAGETITYASGAPAGAEYYVQATFRQLTDGVVNLPGIAGRIDTAAETQYAVEYREGIATEFRLFRREAGVFTAMGTYTVDPATGVDVVVKLELKDATKKVYVDGVERISSTDNSIAAAGKAGVRFNANGGDAAADGTGWHLDDFTAVDIAAAASTVKQLSALGVG
jgi:hypothetical protein